MSYYEVLLSSNLQQDPVPIFDPSVKEMVLTNAIVSLNAQSSGSFEFTVPRQHIFYDKIVPMGSNIEVKENGRTIFFGRPLPPTLDFFGNMVYHCEGALAFLNDAYLPPIENAFEEIEFNALLDLVLSQYNSTQARLDRVFSYDPSQFPDVMIYDAEQWNYQKVLDYLRDYMHQFVGGFFYTEWDDGIIQFKWKEKLTETSNQPITFGVNLLEMTRTGKMFYTAAIAKGGQNLDGEVAQMLAPKKMDNTLLAEYGTITAYLEYPDATTVDALDAYCDTYLHEQRFDGLTLEMTAADLHLRNTEYNEFRVGQLVRVVSKPHDVERTLPITQIEVDINSALKKAIIGDLDKIPFTVSVKKAKKETEKKAKEEAKEEAKETKEDPDSSLIMRGPDGNDYAIGIDIDPETDEPIVTATKIPKYIKLSPSSKEYRVGQSLSLSDFTVTAYYGDGTTKNVTSDSTFNLSDGYVFVANDPNYQLRAVYTVAGKSHAASARLIVREGGVIPKTGSIKINGTTYDLAELSQYTFESYYGYTYMGRAWYDYGYDVEIVWIDLIVYGNNVDPVHPADAVAVREANQWGVAFDLDDPHCGGYAEMDQSENGVLRHAQGQIAPWYNIEIEYEGDVKRFILFGAYMLPILGAYFYFLKYRGSGSGFSDDSGSSESGGGGNF